MKSIELLNVRDGSEIYDTENYISAQERAAHPNAEYFTAEIAPEYVGAVAEGWEPDEVKGVALTFRKLVTVKDGKLADVTKSGERVKAVAVEFGGKKYLRIGAAGFPYDEEIIGALVCVVISF